MPENARESKLRKVFHDVVRGSRAIDTPAAAKLFLEAIPHNKTPGICVEVLVSSHSGLEAVRKAVRADISRETVESHILPFLDFLSDPGVKLLAEGQLLRRIVEIVICPNTVWSELVRLFLDKSFAEPGLCSFAWLVLEVASFPADYDVDFLDDLKSIDSHGGLLQAESPETRMYGYKIQKVLALKATSTDPADDHGAPSAGGRHDNDFADFRKINIYPTNDEFLSTEQPFYRYASEVFDLDLTERAHVHLDNQFRLLREDMLAELREDLQIAKGQKRGRQVAHRLTGFVVVDLDCGDYTRAKRCTLTLECHSGLEALGKMQPSDRQKYLKHNTTLLKHQALGALCLGEIVCGFAFIDRDIAGLAQSPPIIRLQVTDAQALANTLIALKSSKNLQFVLIGTPVFAYEPVLEGIKKINDLPLKEHLLDPSATRDGPQSDPRLQAIVSKIEATSTESGATLEDGTNIDQSQLQSLLGALKNSLTVIQGPPGTGKSFIGSRIVKYLYGHSTKRVLIISYTNHALDQDLENLLEVGIPADAMVRLGGKSTTKTETLLLHTQRPVGGRSSSTWAVINSLKIARIPLQQELELVWQNYSLFSPSFTNIMEHLEFSEEYEHYHTAFTVPKEGDDWKKVDRRGREIRSDYLYSRWINGQDTGICAAKPQDTRVWGIPHAERQKMASSWVNEMLKELVESVQICAKRLDENQTQLDNAFDEQKVQILNSKRIIACTTTAAAKYNRLLRATKPDVVLVEEAGEILECHVLAALTPTVERLILIGDHKQLRPKINNYQLSVEKGSGYDLNRSLFERLILQGYPHTTLRKQHRMHPDISKFPRLLTYPDMVDAPRTTARAMVDGIGGRVTFIHHEHPETGVGSLGDRRDPTSTSSKKNDFEADMILKIVIYLSQQGYKTDNMVVLTPYLGQLRNLQDKFRDETNPILNDLDAHDLLRAGLLTQAAAQVDKKPLRLSTIDNYQGEESNIVVASLTRSNPSGDIGFMAAPERLNVLLSRARCAIIMIGNMNTFISSKKGKSTWEPFIKLLKDGDHLQDGLSVHCSRHPERASILKTPKDFHTFCPDGGCDEPCSILLSCELHKCPKRCHRLQDHSKVECPAIIEHTCERQHKVKVTCGHRERSCRKCVKEDKDLQRRLQRDLDLEKKRIAREEAYRKEKEALQDEIEHHRRRLQVVKEEEDEAKDIALIRKRAKQLAAKVTRIRDAQLADIVKSANTDSTRTTAKPAPIKIKRESQGQAEDDWQWLKDHQGAESGAMDKLMEMIGLQDVKLEFLSVQAKVDTVIRQNASLATERFSCVMMGNPGTGKTTVARLYADFLCSVGVIPGDTFKETTGSALAHGGIAACQKLIDTLLDADGGVLFIDEAYQLTSGNTPGGRAVLDFLLPEVENLRGKVVFVLAGYVKEMETVFAHNPGIPSRFPIEMKFADYSDDELLSILDLNISNRYSGEMQCEDGIRGLYGRIVTRRLGRRRGKEGFGNARAIENTLDQIMRRQSKRIFKERREGREPDYHLITKEDMIGPEPSNAVAKSVSWQKLGKLIGLDAVKNAVGALMDSIQQNYVRELQELPPIEYSLNKVFLGNPGTGKTTVAKLYAGILVDLGLLSKGEVVVKSPADFVGDVIGASEKITKGILNACVGKVVVIDEAYGLYGGGHQGSNADPFKTAIIDTIVAEVQSVPGDDRCVLLLGYHEQMNRMFQNVNPGLSRRFPMASAFVFDDFDQGDLRKILDLKLQTQAFTATEEAIFVIMEMLNRARNRPNFGNAGEIDILLDSAKAKHQSRLSRGQAKSSSVLEPMDFDEDFDRADRSNVNLQALFADTIGCENVVNLLQGYQETVHTMRSLDLDPKEGIPFNFLFRGPPGTGKTTTARKMGKVFYDMGFLASPTVEECSASDLIGQYIGQTGPKVKQLLDKALGSVLFVDEAYRLAGGAFAQEAIDELTDSITKPRYAKKLIIILAGYEKDINRLMSVNPGLTSRFPEVIDFENLSAEDCVNLLHQQLQKQKRVLEEKGAKAALDVSIFAQPSTAFRGTLVDIFTELSKQDNWASARDVGTVSTKILNSVLKSADISDGSSMIVTESCVHKELQAMLHERKSRNQTGRMDSFKEALKALSPGLAQDASMARSPPPPATVSQARNAAHSRLPDEDAVQPAEEQNITQSAEDQEWHFKQARRDVGVSDEVWAQLQKDKQAEVQREKEFQRLKEASKTASAEARERILQQLLEEEREREREMERRKALETSGLCPMGFVWIRQASGYRCAGGSHFVHDGQLPH